MNQLSLEKRTRIIGMLVEGNSLRSTSRMADVSINTVTKLLVDVGQACQMFHDETVRGLLVNRIQCDEIWSFVYSKQKNTPEEKRGQAGDVWTWTAIDADTKLIVSWMMGSRDAAAAYDFLTDVRGRVRCQMQLTTDGHSAYLSAVNAVFGRHIDYAQLIKHYGKPVGSDNERKYSPAECTGITKVPITGTPDHEHVSTSFVERQNLTMRMSMRRFTRLTNGFSKKIENHGYALALHFVHYNFCRQHKTTRQTPAGAAGLYDGIMKLEEVVALVDKYKAAA